MKRYKIHDGVVDSSCYFLQIREDSNGEWVKWEDVSSLIIKLTQDDIWNSPILKPINGASCIIMLFEGQIHPAIWQDKWIKHIGYQYNFDFSESDVIKWRYEKRS